MNTSPTHVVANEYQILDKERRVTKDWTIRTHCGREFPSSTSTLAPKGAVLCKTCKRAVGW